MNTLTKIMIGVSALLLGASITFMTLFIFKTSDYSDMTDLAEYTVDAYKQSQDTLYCMIERNYGDGRSCDNELNTFEVYSNNMYKIGISEYNFD